ncbi:hypothetical protein EVAR_30720_1 [Eumeta japonica]|uniref:Uncharacterized protein n=1 Tax=Eumeta variegata TaxID=151549 RepID=A0A4C1V5R0_EUMVA|nr:hypothetical protein EVAR_30720_1 [Eumeta japonica]
MVNKEIEAAKNFTQPVTRQQNSTTTEINCSSSLATEDALKISRDLLDDSNDSFDRGEPAEHCEYVVDNVEPTAIFDRIENQNGLEYVEFHREDVSNTTNSLTKHLRFWLPENSISQKAANNLIAIFRRHGQEKKNVRTF